MRIIKTLLLAFTAFIFIISCSKEYSMELGLAAGSLKQDGTGYCLPATISGTYKVDTLLKPTNFIDIQVDITETGLYNIFTDTVNGYSFRGSGSTDIAGVNTVRLTGSGKPLAPGVNTFTIVFDSTQCSFDVTVVAVGPPAVYTLGGTGSTCTGFTANGTYTVTLPMSSLNTVTLDVNVTTPGSYDLTTPLVNGLTFSAAGNFTATGPQSVTLNAAGTPVASGTFNYNLAGNSGTCTFPITVGGAPTDAVYTLGGAGSACTGFTSAGTYNSGVALTASNTVTLNVNVSTIGAYSISTTAANGVSFSKIGTFTVTGDQSVTLTGSGVPLASGPITHTVNAAGTTCTFVITYGGSTPPSAFTLAGAPGACTTPGIAGTYTSGAALTSSNTVTLQVVVSAIGPYSLTTNTAGGMSFSGSGTFAATGPQTIVLTGSGTAGAAGAYTFTPQAGSSACTFTINVTAGAQPQFITCNINGVPFTFNVDDTALYDPSNPDLLIMGGFSTTDPNDSESFLLAIEMLNSASVTPGTYTMAASGTTYQIYAEYTDPPGTGFWDPSDGSVIAKDPFTIVISTISATRVTGTFSGTIRNDSGEGPLTKAVTNGSFSLNF